MTGRSQWVKAGSGRRFRVELNPNEWDEFVFHVRKNTVMAAAASGYSEWEAVDSSGFMFMGMPWVKGTEPGVILRNY